MAKEEEIVRQNNRYVYVCTPENVHYSIIGIKKQEKYKVL